MEKIKQDRILVVKIDELGKLHIKPEVEIFSMIQRTATEVHWNIDKLTLYSPKPRDWNYLDWYLHIINVVKKECFVNLNLTSDTEWINIPNELKIDISKAL